MDRMSDRPGPTRDEILARSPFLRLFIDTTQSSADRRVWAEELNQLSHPIQLKLENKFRTPEWWLLAVGGIGRVIDSLGIFQDGISKMEYHQYLEWIVYSGFEMVGADENARLGFLDDITNQLDSLGVLHPRTLVTSGLRHDPPEHLMMRGALLGVMNAGVLYRAVEIDPEVGPSPTPN